MKILIDNNVLIDYMMKREPFYNEALQIVNLCTEEKLNGFVAAHSITDAFYILRKYPIDIRREHLRWACSLFTVIGIDQSKLLKAINDEDFYDIEDCLQEICAEEYFLDYIVTRNVKDFKGGSVPAITPSDLLEKINAE